MEFLSIILLIFGCLYSKPLLRMLNQEVKFREIRLKNMKQGNKEIIEDDVC